jgi:asparagine synthase (glutamine-hydrolysing)
MRVKDGNIRTREYWNLDFGSPIPGQPSRAEEERLADELGALLTDATRIRLRSDVPVGSYLSGGLDSSIITALARRLHSDELCTFSVTFDRGDLDEQEYQLRVSRRIGTQHYAIHANDQRIAEVFPEVVFHAETPLLRTAPAPLYLLSRCVNDNGLKVVLTGEGADEILGGYDIYKESKVRLFWARQPESQMRSLLLKRLYPYMPALQSQSAAYLRRFFRPADLSDPFDSHRPRWQLTASLKQLFSAEVRNQIYGSNERNEIRSAVPSQFLTWDWLSRAQYLESKFLLPGYILSSQGDRMAMAHSVELRPPFLDHRIAEFACRLPATMKVKVLTEKYLLKRAARSLLPDEVVRRPKQPFRSPDATSFFACGTHEYVLEALGQDAINKAGLFDRQKVAALTQKFRAGRASGTRDNMALVGVLSTQLLIERMARQCRAPENFSSSAGRPQTSHGASIHFAGEL